MPIGMMGSLVTLCLLVAMAPSQALAALAAQAPAAAKPEEAGEESKTAPADVNVGYFLALPFRSPTRTHGFLAVATLRYICPRGYAALEGEEEVPCEQSIPTGDEKDRPAVNAGGRRRSFTKAAGPGAIQSLDLVTIIAPGGGYELHLFGRISGRGGDKPNPDLASLKSDLEALLKELESAPLGVLNDGILSYQLSYVQADRAVAVLKTLGYPVVEYMKKEDKAEPVQTVLDNIFVDQASPSARPGLLSRPVVIKLVDSESTSLVEDQDSFIGGGDSELKGGQRLGSITDGAPQQRLLIIFDKNDRDSLDLLLARLQRDIDVPARQILIEALVIELENNRLLDLGVDFKGSKDNYDFSFEEAGGLIQPFIFNFDRPHPNTLFEFMAKLRALVDRGRAKVLSRPSVFVLDGRQAKIKVGDNIPYTSALSISNGVITSSTSFLKTGIILNLRPRAAVDNSEVTLQVETIVSSPGPARVLPDIGVLVAPAVQSRQVQTLVRVANDTPFVIGGLIAQTDQKNTVGIPGLSRIPILGGLFRKENSVNDRREVIIVITPHIVAAADPTFAYTIPRDAQGADTDGFWGGLKGRGPLPEGKSERCEPGDPGPVFGPRVLNASKVEKGSIFDSFDAQLFRNVYRLRSSDIFDLSFIRERPDVKSAMLDVQDLAKRMTSAHFTGRPRIDPADLEKEVKRRLRKEICGDAEKTDCLPPENERTFLTIFDGGVPGEEIFVHQMMIRIIERLGFSGLVPPEHVILFRKGQGRLGDEDLDPKYITEEDFIRECLERDETIVMAFAPEPGTGSGDKFRQQCLQPHYREMPLAAPDPGSPPSSGKFSPPSVRLICMPLDDAKYVQTLRKCNLREEGEWMWQAILLNRTFCEGRDRNSIALLQSVLALERLLDLNDSETFPRTLRAFHVGREIVFPTREDLMARRYLIGRRTAQLFYETLDYYEAFGQAYEQKLRALQGTRDKLRRNYPSGPSPP